MIKYQHSIRQKIRLGYYAVVLMIIGLSAFTFLELRYLEKKIMVGETISEFFDTTLEIRRFEKNYFLFEQRSDYAENLRYALRAGEILDVSRAGFAALASPEVIVLLRKDLRQYQELMDRYEKLIRRQRTKPTPEDQALKVRLEGKIRKTGKDIVTVAEEISRNERSSIQALLAASQRFLLISLLVLIALVIVIGQVLERMVVKPLKLMERNMEVIAEGTFENIPIDSRDREVLSLTRAFNKMLRELELRQRHLVQSEKLASLGTLLSGVAHELNNPLSNISSSGQILAEELDSADPAFKRELVDQINEQTDRARNIVRSLLEFSRDREFKKQRIPLRGLINETIRFIKGQIPAKASIQVNIAEDVEILADKQRIQQVFLNLLKNAAEAIPGEGTITIAARFHRAIDKVGDDGGIYNYLKYHGKCTLEDDTVDIEVRDTGSGIPEDILTKVFDPFFTTKDVGRGSGLGLFIVHEIIDEHDGCIAVDSEAGKGTVFLIRLPMK
ncbi:MAG: ATP-binding protein [Nitrospirota bacterium]|nr:ATP-binding protein [Nitrospirota bacterium]